MVTSSWASRLLLSVALTGAVSLTGAPLRAPVGVADGERLFAGDLFLSTAHAAPVKGYKRVPGNSVRPQVERMLLTARKLAKHTSHISGRSQSLKDDLADPVPSGMLIVGASGTGKSELLKAIREEHGGDYDISVLEGSKLAGPCEGGCAAVVDKLWASMATKAKTKPGLLLIDGLDLAEPAAQQRLAELMDGLEERPRITVVATARAADSVQSQLRRPGVFDSEQVIKALDEGARKDILLHLVADYQLDAKLDFGTLAKDTPGTTAADLKGMVARATSEALNRAGAGDVTPANTKLTKDDFSFVYDDFSPSGLRGMSMKVAKVSFADVGGLTKVKQELIDNVIGPLRNPEKYKGFIKRNVKGVILYGPPGTGKTLVAEAVANEAGVNFISINASDIFRSSYVGDASRSVSEIKAKIVAAKPAIVLFDEADGLLGARTQTHSDGGQERAQAMNDLLQWMDGPGRESDGVVFMMTTNRPELIDSAVKRSGRTDLMLHVGLQGPKGRFKALTTLLRGRKLDKRVSMDDLVDQTARYTGAELEAMADAAGRHAANRGASAIEVEDFRHALTQVVPQTPASEKEDDSGE